MTNDHFSDLAALIRKNFGDIKSPPNVLFQEFVHALSKDKARALFQELRQRLRRAEKSRDPIAVSFAYLHMAMVFRGQRNYASAINMLAKSQTGFESENHQVGLAALYEELACVNRELSRNALALEYSQKAVQLYQELQKPLELAWVYDNMAVIFLNMARRQESLLYAKKARVIFQEHDNPTCLAWNACNLGNLHQEMGAYPEAKKYYEEALKTFEALKIKQGIAWCLLWLGMLARTQTDFKPAEKYLQKAWKAFEALDLRDRAGWAVLNLAGIKWAQGKLAEATTLNKKALQMFGPLRNNDGLAWGIFQNAQILRDQGRLTNAWQLVRQSINLYSHIASQKGTGWAECELGEIYLMLADQSHARECFLKAKNLAEKLELLPLRAEVEKNQANVFLELGLLRSSEAALRSSEEMCKRLHAIEIQGEVLLAKVRGAIVMSDWTAAHDYIDQASETIESYGLMRLRPALDICLGEWFMAQSRPAEAMQVFIEALDRAEEQDQRLSVIEATLGMVQAARAMKTAKRALNRLSEVEKKIRTIGSRKMRAKFLVIEAVMNFEMNGLLDTRPLRQALQIVEETGLIMLKRQFLELFVRLCEKGDRSDEKMFFKNELDALLTHSQTDVKHITSRDKILDLFPVSVVS